MLRASPAQLLLVKEICRAEVDCNRKTVSTPLHAVVLPLLIVVAVSIKSCCLLSNREVEDLPLLLVTDFVTEWIWLEDGRSGTPNNFYGGYY